MNIIDKVLLAPYYLSLKFRHFLYDKNIKKSYNPTIPTICVGNITVGGTGKTPHTEMILRLLNQAEPQMKLSVLSRGYKRSSKGFQQVPIDGSAKVFGDEPLQIKKKFPNITVAVDSSRKRGLIYLANPKVLKESKRLKKCMHPDFSAVDAVILDDAFQHRQVKPSASIVLMDYYRPINEDHLLPLGKLRDLPSRASKADILIFTKCPNYMDEWEKQNLAQKMGVDSYDLSTCSGVNKEGRKQWVFFTEIKYIAPAAIFENADQRYVYSKRLILFTGIANDKPLMNHLCDNYRIVDHLNFPDHHNFKSNDIRQITQSSDSNPTAVIMTTEKDRQRILDSKNKIPETYQKKMFQVPIEVDFLDPEVDKKIFIDVITSFLK